MALNITYGVSTWLWTSPFQTSSIEELFPKIAAMGFDAVEIAVEDPGVHKNCFKYIEACLDFCVLWDIKVFAGPMYSAVGKARMVSPEQRKKEWNLAVSNLRLVCDMAEKRGLKLAIEPLNRFESDLINTAKDVVRLVSDINHPAAGILLDGFHMNIEERDVEAAIRLAGDKLLHVQVSENYRGTPGTGQTRWDAFKAGLEAVGYEDIVAIESFTPEIKELAEAVCIWYPFADDQDEFASDGLKFIKSYFNT